MVLEKSAGAVVFYKKDENIEYLLLSHQWGHFDFPKGNVEKGEKLEETAEREIEEETDLKEIEFVPGFEEKIKYHYKLKNKSIFKTVIFLLAESKTKKVKVSYEHKGYVWLPYEKALEQLTFENAKQVLNEANNFLKSKHG